MDKRLLFVFFSKLHCSSPHRPFTMVIEDDVNEALRLMKMSKVITLRGLAVFETFLLVNSLTLLTGYGHVFQVSLEDTLFDEAPKLDSITAVYMVRTSVKA